MTINASLMRRGLFLGTMIILASLAWIPAAPAQNSRPPATAPAADGPIDWDRARQLLQRSNQGEKLSPEDQAYLDRAKAAHDRGQGGPGQGGPNAAPPPPPPRESTDLVPLTQIKGDQKYKGMDGGLYGGGSNEPSAALAKAAATVAQNIVPLNADGKADPNGKIVLMSIGMSNTTMEFSRFKQIADGDAQKSAKLVIVDGAFGGMDADRWAKPLKGPDGKDVWARAEGRLGESKVTPQQVQVVWIKQGLMGEGKYGEFPAHADVLRDDYITILNMARQHYPNVKLAFLSSRIYAGYATTSLNPEPYAYEGAFSIRAVIDMQTKGDPRLNWDAARGEVKSPLVLWGPYLWANGVKGRELDDLVYKREDLGGDGTHPSASGQAKVAQVLLKFFKTDPAAKGWFVQGEK